MKNCIDLLLQCKSTINTYNKKYLYIYFIEIFYCIFFLLFLRFRVSNKYRVLNHQGWVNNSFKQKQIKRYYTLKEKDCGDRSVDIYIEEDCLTQNKMLINISKKVQEENNDIEKVELNSIKCENYLTELTAGYNKHLTDQPNDIESWIQFVNHQVRFNLTCIVLKIKYYCLTGSLIFFKSWVWL